MAKHAVSFRELLQIRYSVRQELAAFNTLKKTLLNSHCTVPVAIENGINQRLERIVELNSIKHDRFIASERRQAQIGCGVTF